MAKRKTQTQSSLMYWWNELLFSRYFEYETDKDVEELAEHLRDIAHKKRGWFYGMYKESDVDIYPNNKGLEFTIDAKRRRQLDPIGIATARAHGEATVDSATGTITVSGAVKFGRFFQIYLVIMFIIFGTSLATLAQVETFGIMLFLGLVWFGMLGAYWWRMYTDRQEVFEAIDSAIEKKGAYNTSRLADAQEDFDYDDYTDGDYQQQQRRG